MTHDTSIHNTNKAFNAILPYNSKSYSTLLDLLSSATPYVSCFGIYKVSVKGHKGSINLGQIESLVVSLIKANLKFDETERKMGKTITSLISDLNSKCEKILKKKCCLIRIIFKIIKFFSFSKNHSLYYYSEYYTYFNCSTPLKMHTEFPDLTLKEIHTIYENAVSTVAKKGNKTETLEIIDVKGNKISKTRKQKNDLNKSIHLVAEKYKEIKLQRPRAPFEYILDDLRDWSQRLPVTNL